MRESCRASMRTTSPPAPTRSRPTRSAPTASSSPCTASKPRCVTSTGGGRGQPAAVGGGPAGRDVWVLGSMGPLGKYLEPLGAVTADEAREVFREQAEALLEGGVDGFVVETFSDLAEIALAVEAIRSITDLPVIAQMAFT